MQTTDRDRNVRKILQQIEFAKELLCRMSVDVHRTLAEQNEDEFDRSAKLKNRYRYAQDARRIRREVLALVKLLEDA